MTKKAIFGDKCPLSQDMTIKLFPSSQSNISALNCDKNTILSLF